MPASSDLPLAVLFDFDGVIADSEPLHFRAFRTTAASVHIDLTEPDYYANLIGYDDRGAWRKIFSLHDRAGDLDDVTLGNLMRRKTAVVEDAIERCEFSPLPGVNELVQ